MSEKPRFDPSKHLLPYEVERRLSSNTRPPRQSSQNYSFPQAASQAFRNPNGWKPQEEFPPPLRNSPSNRYDLSPSYALPPSSSSPLSVRKDTEDEVLAKQLLQILESEREAARKAEWDDMELARLMQNQENQIGSRHEPHADDYNSMIHRRHIEISQPSMNHSERVQEDQDATLARAIMEAETRSSAGRSRTLLNGPSSSFHANEPLVSHDGDLKLALMMQAMNRTKLLNNDSTFRSSDSTAGTLNQGESIVRVQDEDEMLSRSSKHSTRNDVQRRKISSNEGHARRPSASSGYSSSPLDTYPRTTADTQSRTLQGKYSKAQQGNYTGSSNMNGSFSADGKGRSPKNIHSSSPAKALGRSEANVQGRYSADSYTRAPAVIRGRLPAEVYSISPAGVHDRSSVDLHERTPTDMHGGIKLDVQGRSSLDMYGQPPVNMHSRPPMFMHRRAGSDTGTTMGGVNNATEGVIYNSSSANSQIDDRDLPDFRRQTHPNPNNQPLRQDSFSNASASNGTRQHNNLNGLGAMTLVADDNTASALIPLEHPHSSTPAPQQEKKKKKKGSKLKRILLKKLYSLGSVGKANKKAPPLPVVSVPLPRPHPPISRQTPGPLPHSVSINRTFPMTISPQPQVGGAKPRKRTPTPFSRGKPQSSVPTCEICGQVALSYLQTLDKKYHPECFKCMGCHEVIDPSGPFAFSTGENGDKFPLHRRCYAELFGIKCAVCKESIPAGPDGKVSYVKHPFFDSEQMCPSHAKNPGRRCTGCHRFEPNGTGFADLGDADRCVCFSCCRSVVVDSEDAKPLWDRVIYFFEQALGLPVWAEMREVPVLVVGYDALNDHIANTAHSGSSQIMTRGLCLSEHQSGRRIPVPRIRFDRQNRSFRPSDVESKGYTYFLVPDTSKINPESSVTAILCLSGLPSDLTASVLAHEATHAWFKLHPNFDIADPIPMQVEEGCCQLVAMLFLNDGLDHASTEYDDHGPSDEKLRQYFKFSIETDEHEIYGTGYRMAAKAYASIGIEALLSHVVMYKDIPDV